MWKDGKTRKNERGGLEGWKRAVGEETDDERSGLEGAEEYNGRRAWCWASASGEQVRGERQVMAACERVSQGVGNPRQAAFLWVLDGAPEKDLSRQ